MLQEKRIISHLDQLEMQFLEHLIWISPRDLSWLHSLIEVKSSSTNFSSVSNHINVSPNPEGRRETEDFVQQISEVEETCRLDFELNLTDEMMKNRVFQAQRMTKYKLLFLMETVSS